MFNVHWLRDYDNALVANSTLQWLPKIGEAVRFEAASTLSNSAVRFGSKPVIYRVKDIVYKLPTGSFANIEVLIILTERSSA